MTFEDTVTEFEEKLKLSFNNKELLETALTHSSFARRNKRLKINDNERLEFYGDAVLKLIVSDFLFHHYPNSSEGELTTIRAHIISDKSLAWLGQEWKLGEYMRFSYGEENSGGKCRMSNIANAVEAILGALFLDQGYNKTTDFFTPHINAIHCNILTHNGYSKDFKTALQESLQRKKEPLPTYTIIDQKGPAHHRKFIVKAMMQKNGQTISEIGEGLSKKEAEQLAAKKLLDHWET